MQADNYLLTCMRYIELNPVRAAMVEDPAHYLWSSYQTNRLMQTDSRLIPHDLYLRLGANPDERSAAYRALFRPHLDREAINHICLAFNQNQPLGDSRFHATIEAMTGVRRAARPRGRPRTEESTSNEAMPGQGELKID